MGARILGVGAPLGDDAVGFAIVREVVRRGVPEGVGVHEIAEPSQLVPLLGDADPAIVVDALLAPPPGRVLRLRPEELASGEVRPLSTHGVDVRQAIELAATLSGTKPRVVLVGVTIDRSTRLDGLSRPVERAVGEAADLVLRILEEG